MGGVVPEVNLGYRYRFGNSRSHFARSFNGDPTCDFDIVSASPEAGHVPCGRQRRRQAWAGRPADRLRGRVQRRRHQPQRQLQVRAAAGRSRGSAAAAAAAAASAASAAAGRELAPPPPPPPPPPPRRRSSVVNAGSKRSPQERAGATIRPTPPKRANCANGRRGKKFPLLSVCRKRQRRGRFLRPKAFICRDFRVKERP